MGKKFYVKNDFGYFGFGVNFGYLAATRKVFIDVRVATLHLYGGISFKGGKDGNN